MILNGCGHCSPLLNLLIFRGTIRKVLKLETRPWRRLDCRRCRRRAPSVLPALTGSRESEAWLYVALRFLTRIYRLGGSLRLTRLHQAPYSSRSDLRGKTATVESPTN